jgi:hypothetical protein
MSQDECFDKCDGESRCAAACITPFAQCQLFNYGFERTDGITDFTSYIKPEVSEALASEGKLSIMYPVVKINTRLVTHYDAFDTLTPAQCFKLCSASRMCGGASFTVEIERDTNCFLFKGGEFTESTDADGDLNWISYTKAGSAETRETNNDDYRNE